MSARGGQPVHGGDVEAIARLSGRPAAALLDFSANINPLGPPPEVIAALRKALEDTAALVRYPDAEQPALRAALARHTRTTPEAIALGNGSAALLHAAIRSLAPRRCIVPVPAFSEYAAALHQHGAEMVPFPLSARDAFALDTAALVAHAKRAGADLCIVNNPHNPSGAVMQRGPMRALSEQLGHIGCRTIVDEAFVDYVPTASIAGILPPKAIVLRSLTKFYAMPGLRIGYAVGAPADASALEARLPSWPVSTLAYTAARAALDASAYAQRTIATNAIARADLHDALQSIGVGVWASAANFVLVDLAPRKAYAADVRDRLLERGGIIVRACDDYENLAPTFIRVAVRSAAENATMVSGLDSVLACERPSLS